MAIPLRQKIRVGAYLTKQRVMGVERYPLVLMLEPLFRCNLACAGCGKIDYPDAILNQRLSVKECLDAVDECGAPVVSIAGGEPLLHREIEQVVEGIVARKKFVYLCTNALLMEKKIDRFKPNPFFVWSVHLDGDREMHDKSVCEEGVYDRAVAAIKPLTISAMSRWSRGSPPAMETAGAPHSSIASMHCCTERRWFNISSG